MKKKLVITLLSLVCALSCLFGLVACGGSPEDSPNTDKHKHNWSSTYIQDGDSHYQTCSGCDEKNYSSHSYNSDGVCVCGKQRLIEAHVHIWETDWDDNATYHWRNCTVTGCDEKDGYATHAFNGDGECIVCGRNPHAVNPGVPEQPGHVWALEWSTNNTHHWYACIARENDVDCAEKKDYAEHDFTNGICICGKRKPSAAEGPLSAMVEAYTALDLNALAELVYTDKKAYQVFLQNNTATEFFQDYRKMELKSTELIYDDGVDAGFSVTIDLTYGPDNGIKTERLRGDIYLANKSGRWYLTEIPDIDIANHSISTRENDGAELYFGDNIYSTVPVFIAPIGTSGTDGSKEDNAQEYIITVPIENAPLDISNFFKCFNANWSLKTEVNDDGDWQSKNVLLSYDIKNRWKIEVYDNYGDVVEELELGFLQKRDITVTFYDYDKRTVITEQTFKQFKKATPEIAPEHIGATFVGWFTVNYEAFDFTQRINADVRLYAAYETAATKDIIDSINAITEITLEKKEEFNRIQAAFDALSDEQQAFVYNIEKLNNAQTEMFALEWEAVDCGGYYELLRYKGNDSVVHIPSEFRGIEIRVMGDNVFEGKTIEELYIPNTVQNIGGQGGSLDNAVVYCESEVMPSGCAPDFAGNATVVWNVHDVVTENGLTFVLYGNGNAVLTKISTIGGDALAIPESVRGYNVTEISSGALSGLQVRTLDMPFILLSFLSVDGLDTLTVRGVDEIDAASFASLKNSSIDSLVIFGTANEVAANAFRDFARIGSITLSDNVITIRESAFSSCASLENIILGEGVMTIGERAFEGCTSLKSVRIPEAAVLGSAVFDGCPIETVAAPLSAISKIPKTHLKTVVITSGETIGDRLFYGCTSLTSVSLPDTVTTIGVEAFKGCVNLEEITLPTEIISIGTDAFSGCRIRTATVPMSVVGYLPKSTIETVIIKNGTEVDSAVFYGCYNLKSITIPGTVTLIAENAFVGCSGLEEIVLEGGNTKYHVADGCLIETARKTLLVGCMNSVIPTDGSVTALGAYAFYGRNLTSIVLPDCIVSIGEYAFEGCPIESATVPASVLAVIPKNNLKTVVVSGGTTVEHNVFAGSPVLERVTLLESVKRIEVAAFMNCRCLTYLSIPDSIEYIGVEAFYGCERLPCNGSDNGWYLGNDENLYVALMYPRSSNMISSINVHPDTKLIATGALQDCPVLQTVRFWGDLRIISDNAFWGCSMLRQIQIPDSVVYIGWGAFYGCTSLENMVIPAGVMGFGDESTTGDELSAVFGECISLKNVTLPENMTSIGAWMFGNCTSLKSVTIPNGVTYIGRGAFYGCSSLTNIVIPNSVTTICESALEGCTGLNSITIPFVGANGDVESFANTHFGYLFGATRYSENEDKVPEALRTVTITGGIYIYDFAFARCKSLTSISVSDTVKYIGQGAFQGCESLTEMTLPNSIEQIGFGAFIGCNSIERMTIPFVGHSRVAAGLDGTHFGYLFGAREYIENPEYVSESLKAVELTDATTVELYAFYFCEHLTDVTLNDGVTVIKGRAFMGCDSLTHISIPDSITYIGSDAFGGEYDDYGKNPHYCENLQYTEYDNALYLGNNKNSYVVLVKAKNTKVTACTVHSGTRVVYANAFTACSALSSVTIADSVKQIGYQAFMGCSSLASIHIPEGVTLIDNQALAWTQLTTMAVPNSIEGFWVDILYETSYLQYNAYDNALYLGNSTNQYLILVKAKNTSITSCLIHPNTKIIASEAFANCAGLTNIVLPSKVTFIGYRAFKGCSALTNITLPDGIKTIEYEAFNGCTSLQYNEYDTALYLGNDANHYLALIKPADTYRDRCVVHEDTKLIADNAFLTNNRYGENYLVLPEGIAHIGNRAVVGRRLLVEFVGTKEQWLAIEKEIYWDAVLDELIVICSDGELEYYR